jgi:hypothetical protein
MIYDSWVLTGYFYCNILLIAMTAIAYVYQSIQDKKSQQDNSDRSHISSDN